ncbi:MAG: EpsI family protein [Pseudomonadales bacterium]|nr:EpsI family protein [Pseudomonadales bacterium]
MAVSLLAMVLLIAAGTAYRQAAAHFSAISDLPINLKTPLKEFPVRVGNWTGTDVPISETILKVANNDDYLMRKYQNSVTGQSVNLYIAFSARPSTMRGHRPEVCYPGSGWVHDTSTKQEIPLVSGRSLSCLVHRFHKPYPGSGNVVVLNYYILDGHFTTNEDAFDGLKFRMVNYSGKAHKYVTQVQISSSMTNSVISAASEFGDLISKLFPDTNAAQ